MSFFDPNYSVLPDRAYLRELWRPWKLATLAVGMGWLLYGATHYNIGDWDIGVSIVMGVLAYLLAPWSMYVILNAIRYRPKWWWAHMAAALAAGIFVADTSYMAYHLIAGNPTYRDANFPASISLYFLAGGVWLYRGTLIELIRNASDITLS
ncbi:MAG: hypothetical protein JSS45_11925 [Proteobacteria bacterium]|nr:hypothetical protein [Pseudomonadota bacterium]